MGAGLSTEVLLALLDVADVGVSGAEVQQRLKTQGQEPRADKLMVALLRLEDTGHVAVDRSDGMRFALTEKGRDRAYELGGGKPVHLQLLMADLVSFTEFTSTHGDVGGAGGGRHAAPGGVGRLPARRGRGGEGDGRRVPRLAPAERRPHAGARHGVSRLRAAFGRAVAAARRQPRRTPHPAPRRPVRSRREPRRAALRRRPPRASWSARAAATASPSSLTVRGFDDPIPVWRVAIP